jgi:hypothetical protein
MNELASFYNHNLVSQLFLFDLVFSVPGLLRSCSAGFSSARFSVAARSNATPIASGLAQDLVFIFGARIIFPFQKFPVREPSALADVR